MIVVAHYKTCLCGISALSHDFALVYGDPASLVGDHDIRHPRLQLLGQLSDVERIDLLRASRVVLGADREVDLIAVSVQINGRYRNGNSL